MKIASLIPGSGGTFYCDNCLRDLSLIRGLREIGHETVVVPLYLPPSMQEPELVSESTKVFFGAVGVYLKHRYPWVRRLPRSITNLLDLPPFLALAAHQSGSTRARGLETLTLSMLRGEQGGQADDLRILIDWLKNTLKPDALYLSNALLSGIAPGVKREMGIPVVCSLQDEDTWIDDMPADAAAEAWQLIGANSGSIASFVAVSNYYAKRISQKVTMRSGLLKVVSPGIDSTGFAPSNNNKQPLTLGFLSRLSEPLGLGVLIDAFILLKKDPALADLKCNLLGGHTGDDHRFLRSIRNKLKKNDCLNSVTFYEDFSRSSRAAFLQSLSLLSVPVLQGEAYGVFLLEAMACGIPVVQPDAGAFPEIIARSKAGVIYGESTDANALALQLAVLLKNREKRMSLSIAGLNFVRTEATHTNMARALESCFRKG